MLLGLVIVIAVGARTVDWPAVVRSISSASIPLVLATAAVSLISTVIKGARWWLFLRRSTELRLAQVMRLTIAAMGLNSLLFANAGDFMRLAAATRQSGRPATTILASLASDKVAEVLAFATMVLVVMMIQPVSFSSRRGIELAVIGAAILAALALAGTRSRRVRAFITETRARLRGPDVWIAWLMSLVSWPAQVAAYGLGALAIGLHVPITATMSAVVAVNIAGVVRSTPGNVGVFQLMYALTLSHYGIGRLQAVAAALLIQSVQLSSAIIAGAVCLPWTRSDNATSH
jgi:uncharacterized membrane protein YbhN (UPF0104 family)